MFDSHEPDWLPGEPKPGSGIIICGALVMLLYFAGVVTIGTGIINDETPVGASTKENNQ